MKKIYYCEKCGKWCGLQKLCPDCKAETALKTLPLARGNYYYIKGVEKPLDRVTGILKDVLATPALTYWSCQQTALACLADPTISVAQAINARFKKRDKAGMRGTDVHRIIDNIGKRGEIDEEAIAKIPQIIAYQKFCTAMPHKTLMTEKVVYSVLHGYAGTLDGVIQTQDGKNWLIDYKTSKGIYPFELSLQLSAYKQALSELDNIKIDGMAGIHLKSDGSFSFVEIEDTIDIFLAVKKIYDYKKK